MSEILVHDDHVRAAPRTRSARAPSTHVTAGKELAASPGPVRTEARGAAGKNRGEPYSARTSGSSYGGVTPCTPSTTQSSHQVPFTGVNHE
jgi:hypothetical protein